MAKVIRIVLEDGREYGLVSDQHGKGLDPGVVHPAMPIAQVEAMVKVINGIEEQARKEKREEERLKREQQKKQLQAANKALGFK